MRRLFSSRIIAPLILTAVLASSAWAAEAPGQRSQMLLAVSETAASGLPAIPGAAIDGALDRAAALTALNIDAMGKATDMKLRLSRPAVYSVAVDANGAHIALTNTVVLPSLQTMTVGNDSVVGGVTTALSAVHPQFVTRVDVSLKGAAGIAVRTENNTLIVTFTPGASGVSGAQYSPADLALARIEEMVRRNDDIHAADGAAIAQSIEAARHEMESANVALLQAELAQVAPAADTKNAQRVSRAEFEKHQTDTALLEADRATLLARRADAVQTARRSLFTAKDVNAVLAAFEVEENKFTSALQALAARAKQQQELNSLIARRIESTTAGSAKASLEQMDSALAAVRTAASLETPKAAKAQPSEVAMANVRMDLPAPAPLAALSKDDDAGTPPAPRARTNEHRLSMDTVARGDAMAVLRSTSDEVVEAEQQGVIRMAQAQTDGTGITEVKPAADNARPASGPRRYSVPKTTGTRPAFNLYNPNVPASEDPLRQIVTLDFQGMELTNVVSLLAEKAQINVIAGTEVTGTVTANLKNVPLGRAIEIVLRMNGLGIVEEAGVYRITTYEEAISAQRQTRMIFLQNAQADDVKKTLDDILESEAQSELISVSSNPATNVVVIAGPLDSIEELEGIVTELDVADQIVPTLTMPIKLNYSEPTQLLPVIAPLLSEAGTVSADPRTRQIIITDIPVKVQEIQALVQTVDLPVKSVSIDALVVDAQLEDGAQTGIDWLLQTNHLQADGDPDFGIENILPITNPQAGAAAMTFGLISDSFNLRATIRARVESTDAEIFANPVVLTVENKPATINISREVPYQELTQTSEGGQLATTKFKDIGTVLKVTPRVTHDDHILATVDVKQSNTTGESVTGVPIEAKRQAQTELRMKNGQSIYIGGLRGYDSDKSNRKVPILGDIPVVNTFFKSQDVRAQHTELLIFMTCTIMADDHFPDLTPFQQEKFDQLGAKPRGVNGTRDLVRTYTHPEEQRDPIYKWRRAK